MIRRRLTSKQREELYAEAISAFVGITIGTAIYMPLSLFVFDQDVGFIFDRAYYIIAGAAIVISVRAIK